MKTVLLLLMLTGCATVFGRLETVAPPQATGLEGELVRIATPATLYLDCSLTQDQQVMVTEAAEYWNTAVGKKLIVVEPECGVPEDSYATVEGTTIKVQFLDLRVVDPRHGEPYVEAAATHLDTNNGLIYHATISLYRTWLQIGYGRKQASIIRHELGHVLGLDHTEDRRCLMYFSNTYDSPDFITQACGAEVRLLRSIYANAE